MQLLKCPRALRVLFRSASTSSGQSNVRVRFAPSPTGYLHLGGLRTALYNYLFAKSRGGQFVLRIEDTDRARLVPGAAAQLEDVLGWAGLAPDESPLRGGEHGPYTQSERQQLGIYTRHAEELLSKGLAYRCFCTEKRLELLKKEAARTKQPNKYDRRCYHLSPAEVEEKLARGEPHTIRFLLSPELHDYSDLVFGQFSHDVFAAEGDPVIVKSDGFPTYHFANVVDDHLMSITHVLRGVEWQVSTPKHLMLYRALGWQPPHFGHLPLIMNSDGTKLSKRQGDLHVESMRKVGYYPESVINFATLVGGGFEEKDNTVDTVYSVQHLISDFNISKMNTHNCKIDLNKLDSLNRSVLKTKLMNTKERNILIEECQRLIVNKMEDLGLQPDNIDYGSVLMLLGWAQDRISKLSDLVGEDFLFLWHFPNKEDLHITIPNSLVDKVIDLLNSTDHDNKSLMKTFKLLSKEHNIKFPDLMKDLRLLITGKTDGPPIMELVDILGKEKVVQRLKH